MARLQDTEIFGNLAVTGNTTVAGSVQVAGDGDDVLRVGDDCWIRDVDVANRIGVQGVQDATLGGIVFGSGEDTNIYRSAANTLKTDDAFLCSSLGAASGTTINDIDTTMEGSPTDNQLLTSLGIKTYVDAAGGGPGSGTQYAIPIWATTTTLGDSIIKQNSGATLAEVAGHFYITGDKEMGSVGTSADPEGLVMQIDYTDANTDSRLFFREASNNLYGGSIIYAADVSPVFDGTTFTNLSTANTFYFLTHSNSLTGTVFMSVLRGGTAVKFPGSIALSLGTSVNDIDVTMEASPTDNQLLTAQGIQEYVNKHTNIGSANSDWINCPYEGCSDPTDDIINYLGRWVSLAWTYAFYSVPLPTTRGGKKLFINGTRVSLADADASNYINDTDLYGMGNTSSASIDNDPTNKDTINLHEDTSMGNKDCSGYGVMKVRLRTVIAAADNLDVQYVTVRYYYA